MNRSLTLGCVYFLVLWLTPWADAQNRDTPKPKDASAQPAQPDDTRQPDQSDRIIMLTVENELLASEAIKSHRLDVHVEDGIVTLSGRVRNLLAKDIAVGLAQRVRGVVSVVDQIEIMDSNRDDAALQADVAAALAADPGTKGLKVDVEVKESVATLRGNVPTYGQKMLAATVASAVIGIGDLENELAVASGSAPTDDVLQKEISELCRFDVQLDETTIEVAVKNGVAVLNGTVSSAFQKSFAEQIAWRAGAKDVDNRGLHVNWSHANPELRTERYERATDGQIQAAIARALSYDPRVLSFKPQVHVEHGIVTLTGQVDHLAAKQAAERIARFTIGVRRVKNNLKVEWSKKSPSDEQIAKFARDAIRRDPYLADDNIIVEVENAHVGLYGEVDNQFEKNHAQWTASRQHGVVHIDNNLAVHKKWTPKTDEAIAADLNEKLKFIFIDDENQVSAKVIDGVAILEGTVDSLYMWQTALDQALAAGAREPHMLIQVRYAVPDNQPYYGPEYYIPR